MNSAYVPANLVRLVRHRAGGACEYCRLPQSSQEAAFHIDHIQPRSAGGPTRADNLALACVTCSLRKGSREVARDPVTGDLVPIFHPRNDKWSDHFAWSESWRAEGKTQRGRATIAALGMNRAAIVAIRRLLAGLGKFPVDSGSIPL